jgi:hypothetical protein
MTVNIYVLVDPRTLKVRYIGRTRCTLKKRLGEHVCVDRSKAMTRVKSWIKSLKAINSKPYIRLLTTCKGWEESHVLEQELIERHKEKHDLLNHRDRGMGNPFPLNSDFTRLQMSKTRKEGFASGRLKVANLKPVFVYSLDGVFIEKYSSITACSKGMGISTDTISRSISGRCKQGKGFLFRSEYSDSITPLNDFHKGVNTPVTVHYTDRVLKFSSFQDCARHFEIVNSHTNTSNIEKQIFFEDPSILYLEYNSKKVERSTSRRKIVKIQHVDEVLAFKSLKEACIHYNWNWKSFGFKSTFYKQFYKHFPKSILTVSPHKIS